MTDDQYAECPGTAVEWEQENGGYLTVLRTAFAEKDTYLVEEMLERLVPAPDVEDECVHQRERMLGDVKVLDLEIRDPRSSKVSCTTGPAVFKHDGTRMWYFAGLQHNACGPAVIRPNGDVEYFYLGTKCETAEALDDMVQRAQRHAQQSKTWRNLADKSANGS